MKMQIKSLIYATESIGIDSCRWDSILKNLRNRVLRKPPEDGPFYCDGVRSQPTMLDFALDVAGDDVVRVASYTAFNCQNVLLGDPTPEKIRLVAYLLGSYPVINDDGKARISAPHPEYILSTMCHDQPSIRVIGSSSALPRRRLKNLVESWINRVQSLALDAGLVVVVPKDSIYLLHIYDDTPEKRVLLSIRDVFEPARSPIPDVILLEAGDELPNGTVPFSCVRALYKSVGSSCMSGQDVVDFYEQAVNVAACSIHADLPDDDYPVLGRVVMWRNADTKQWVPSPCIYLSDRGNAFASQCGVTHSAFGLAIQKKILQLVEFRDEPIVEELPRVGPFTLDEDDGLPYIDYYQKYIPLSNQKYMFVASGGIPFLHSSTNTFFLSGRSGSCTICCEEVLGGDAQYNDDGDVYCSHCFMEEYTYCDYTGDIILRDSMASLDGKPAMPGNVPIYDHSESEVAYVSELVARVYTRMLGMDGYNLLVSNEGVHFSSEFIGSAFAECFGETDENGGPVYAYWGDVLLLGRIGKYVSPGNSELLYLYDDNSEPITIRVSEDTATALLNIYPSIFCRWQIPMDHMPQSMLLRAAISIPTTQ